MKKIIIFSLVIYIGVFTACKKGGSSSTSVVGSWKLTNVSGTSSFNLTPSTGYSTVYTYNTNSDILTETTTIPGNGTKDTAIYQINSEIWTFNNDGSYTINEVFTNSPGSGNTADSSVTIGTWKYQGGAQSSGVVDVSNGISYILGYITNSNSYTVQTSNSSTLVLAVNNSEDTTGALTATNVTLTFAK